MKLDFLKNLIYTKRYSNSFMVNPESVSDHIWHMTSLALEVIPQMNERFDTKVDIRDLVYRISIHDLDESITGDLIRPFKYHDSEFKESVDRVVEEILNRRFTPEFTKDILEAKDPNTLEGLYVKLFDSLQAGIKMSTEVELGNRYFKDQLINAVEVIDHVMDLIKEFTDSEYHEYLSTLISSEYVRINNLMK